MPALDTLSYLQIILSLGIGGLLGLVYLFLLWQTLLKLPKIKHKGNFLFLSAVIRLALLIFTAIYFSFNNGTRFILIIVGFIIARLIVMKYVKASLKHARKGKQHD